jgi:hypothetical protein
MFKPMLNESDKRRLVRHNAFWLRECGGRTRAAYCGRIATVGTGITLIVFGGATVKMTRPWTIALDCERIQRGDISVAGVYIITTLTLCSNVVRSGEDEVAFTFVQPDRAEFRERKGAGARSDLTKLAPFLNAIRRRTRCG